MLDETPDLSIHIGEDMHPFEQLVVSFLSGIGENPQEKNRKSIRSTPEELASNFPLKARWPEKIMTSSRIPTT